MLFPSSICIPFPIEFPITPNPTELPAVSRYRHNLPASLLSELQANHFWVGAYYLYVSGGDTAKARDRAEADARRVRDRSLDQAERVGDKIDRAYDDAKTRVESGFKSTKANLESEYNKEKKEIGKQVEVLNPHSIQLPFCRYCPPFFLRFPIFVVLLLCCGTHSHVADAILLWCLL